MNKHNALNDLKIDLASAGICEVDGLRLSDPLCTHATPEKIAYTIAFDSEPKYSSYNEKHVPDRPCPKCGGLLIVREHRMRVRNSPDRVDNFVGCANFSNGCRHTEPFTQSIRATIDAVVVSDEAEF